MLHILQYISSANWLKSVKKSHRMIHEVPLVNTTIEASTRSVFCKNMSCSMKLEITIVTHILKMMKLRWVQEDEGTVEEYEGTNDRPALKYVFCPSACLFCLKTRISLSSLSSRRSCHGLLGLKITQERWSVQHSAPVLGFSS